MSPQRKKFTIKMLLEKQSAAAVTVKASLCTVQGSVSHVSDWLQKSTYALNVMAASISFTIWPQRVCLAMRGAAASIGCLINHTVGRSRITRSIEDAILRAARLIEAINLGFPLVGDFDDVRDDLFGAVGRLEREIMSTRADTAEELQAKLVVWRSRVEDPLCIHDRDVPLSDGLFADIIRKMPSQALRLAA